MIRIIEIRYSKKADLFFVERRDAFTKDQADQLLIKAVKRIYGDMSIHLNMKKMVTEENSFCIQEGDISLVFSLDEIGRLTVHLVDETGFLSGILTRGATA